ncbi:MAG TPA: ABC transporter permease subunit [Candidatus Dormibacteraeota bacterium]|jgi:hypothetical protein|nr:ABC transporter permease subunit [Candidatus Dormibacteraeota bacterium]
MIAMGRRRLALPVLGRDLRVRMRRRRTAALLGGCLAIAVCAGLVAYGVSPRSDGDPSVAGHAATALFRGAAAATLVLVAVLGTSLGAGAISGEAERGTLELLRATALPSWRLVAGKVLDVVSLLVLVIAAPLPVYGLALHLGGVEAGAVGALLAACLGTAVLTAALGVLFSALAPSTAAASAMAGGALLLLGGLPLVVGVITPQQTASSHCAALLCPSATPSTGALVVASASPLTGALPVLAGQPGDGTPGAAWWHVTVAVEGAAAMVLMGASSLVVKRRRWPA